MLSPDTVLGRLRLATRGAHQQLEAQLDVINRLRADPDRQQLIKNYQKLFRNAAKLLTPWHDATDGHTIPGPGDSAGDIAQVEIQSRAEALGFRYVIEGSALGGRVILRELEALGIDTTELGFLNPHGDRTGAVWRDFTAMLERELAAPPGALDGAVAGAVKGFAYARACLTDGLVLNE